MTPAASASLVPGPAVEGSDVLDALARDIAASLAEVQSPYLYLHAAGSDGSDGSAHGVHLRWALLRSLEDHLPKGNLAGGPGARYLASYGFNRAEDFVTVLRVPYDRRFPCTVSFLTDRPAAVGETGAERWWRFAALVEGTNPPERRDVVVRFQDLAQYDTLRASVDPLTAPGELVSRYTGVLEAEVPGRLCFALTLTVRAPATGGASALRVEAVAVAENLAGADLSIACRKRFSPAVAPPPSSPARSVYAENTKSFRFDYAGCAPTALQLETYDEFLAGSLAGKAAWAVVGTDFALSDDDDTVYERLEDSALANVHHKWPRYLGADPVSGRFTTSVDNYKAKWDPTRPPTSEPTDADGLRQGVLHYLTLSTSPANATALVSLPAQDPSDQAKFEISYLQMLKLLALDFPVARMLGLGCIDPAIPPGSTMKFVYVALYRTTAPLESAAPPALVLAGTATLHPGETAAFPVGLSVPAPANGVFITLTSSDPARGAVGPARVFIPAGATTSTQATLQGAGLGSAIVTASAPGFAPARTQVQVEPVPAIGLPASTTLGLGQTAPFPLTLSAPVPVAEVFTPPGGPVPRTHVFMTLPTSPLDSRLPPAPVQGDPTFGISFDNGGGQPTMLTDADGYAPFDDSRIVNLYVEPYAAVQPFGAFFVPPVELSAGDVTTPVFYGCKYRLVSEAKDRVPELSHDPDYADPSGVAEVAPLLPQVPDAPAGALRPVFTHVERENGLHRYAFYGVNWYSRPSPLSNAKDVDTLIPKRSTLLPPANLAVQLIQPEDPLMLTTAGEQQRLAGLAGDATLVRCTFDWNQAHYAAQKFSPANAYADRVQLCFRPEPPRAVQGEIASVTSLSDTSVEVRTRSYANSSVLPAQIVTPAVVPGDEPRFVGSSFASDQVLYEVESVAQSTVSGEGAVFHVRTQRQSTVDDLDHDNRQSTSEQVVVPTAGKRFLVVENMGELANWGASPPLTREVTLVNFLTGGQLHTETVHYPDGSQATVNVGGIWEAAEVDEVADGIFALTFASYQLAAHPDPDVEWYRGTVRIGEAAGGAMKALAVWKIDVGGATLELTVHDPTFDGPAADYRPIQTGPGVTVNFHPGYRAYLKAQPGVLDQTTVLPGPTESTKQTLLAALSRNTALAIESSLTTPVVVQARKITTLAPPVEPDGARYATRPDSYGKATWTMDVKVGASGAHEPYALLFYRANERAVLDTLYKAATVEGIVASLAGLGGAEAAFGPNRWKDLVNVTNLDTVDHGFPSYTAGGFRFPVPDNDSYAIPATVSGPGPVIKPFDGVHGPGDPNVAFSVEGRSVSLLEVVRNAIEGAFLSLTASPVVYAFIKTGTQTSARKPVVRNRNGDLLPFNSGEFDPSPMAVRHLEAGGDTVVRFTDYTLDGAALNTYFYYAAQMSEQMKLGPRSPIVGPIRLVNAYPAEAPVIRKVTSVLEDPALAISTGVKISVNAYLASEGITAFNLYRATNASDAATTRTMKLARSSEAAAGAETELSDDFSDLAFPPFGDPLFYRVVALREITNERDAKELIPSQPSGLARASIVDVRNPVAPPLVFSSDPPTLSNPVQVPNVVLSWVRAAHNANYRLYKQGNSGNWSRIYQVKTNADAVTVPLSATDLGTGTLLKQNPDGAAIYHRFKLEVENASGLFSLNEEVLSVPATCQDGYAVMNQIVSYTDDSQPAGPLTDQRRDPAVSTFPGSMTFQDIISALPDAHVFDRIEVTVADGLGHAARATITAPGGAVTFHHGDGTGIVLDGSVPSVTYAVRVRVVTDSCQDGLLFTYRLQFGPDPAP
jgi:hypothetical protein